MTGIMMKYMDNIDRDHSMSLDQSEFAWHYAALTHTSAEAVFAIFDENKDEKLTGKSLLFFIFPSSTSGHITHFQKINFILRKRISIMD